MWALQVISAVCLPLIGMEKTVLIKQNENVCMCTSKAHTAKHLFYAAIQPQNYIKEEMSKCLFFWKVIGI